MEETFQSIQDWLAINGLKLITAILILVIGRMVARLLTGLIRKAMDKRNVEPTIAGFLANGIYAILLVIVILAALDMVGVQTTSFIAIIGAAGLAIGLALQGSLANFASGFLLILFRPIKVGDFVEAGGTSGIVEEISIFTTQMRTPDNKTVIVPNSNITGGNIINYSAKDTRRVDLVFGVGYGDDLNKVKDVIWDVIKSDERILKDPEPTVGIVELADSSVNFAVRPWVNSADYWAVFFHLNETMKKRFDEEGISIPFPQQDVHMYQENSC